MFQARTDKQIIKYMTGSDKCCKKNKNSLKDKEWQWKMGIDIQVALSDKGDIEQQ